MSKFREKAEVLSQEMLSEGIYSMWLRTDKIAGEAKAGQFLSLYSADASRMLPRPISICQIDKEKSALRLVYRIAGKGTAEFSALTAGDKIDVVGPLGNGFPKLEKKAFLIGGGIGIPPMLGLAGELKAMYMASGMSEAEARAMIQIVVGYRDANMFLKEDLEAAGTVYIATEDGSVGTKGNVLNAIKELGLGADVIYACGPTPMLRALKTYAEEIETDCYLSLEERMACGVGACLACVCKSMDVDHHSNVKNKRICQDGPVFLGTEVEL